MKTLILGWWMFGFAIARHLWINNEKQDFFLYEKDETVFNSLKTKRENPYFFEWVKLPENILFEENLEEDIWNYDLVIIAIPAQFVVWFLAWFKKQYKKDVIFLNLSKGINNETLETIGEWIERELVWIDYHYSVLSGWMIAGELVEQKILWADIAITDTTKWEELKALFESEKLAINLTCATTKSVELFGALKNLVALSIGYYMWKWLSHSSLGYYLCKLLEEEKELITLLDWGEYFDFSDYSLGGDIIATCFWNSRNRYLGELVWSWKDVESALDQMKQEKKTSEWYATLKWVYALIKEKDEFEELQKLGKIFYWI